MWQPGARDRRDAEQSSLRVVVVRRDSSLLGLFSALGRGAARKKGAQTCSRRNLACACPCDDSDLGAAAVVYHASLGSKRPGSGWPGPHQGIATAVAACRLL